jgi:indole-3-glycerol phosphate synthase
MVSRLAVTEEGEENPSALTTGARLLTVKLYALRPEGPRLGSMPTYLDEIMAACQQGLQETRARTPLDKVQAAAQTRHEHRDFAGALSGDGLHIIAELKKASPSRGLLRPDYRCRELAQGYEAAGAAALSVLTEGQFFQGSLTDLVDARDAVGLPVLRKDFIFDSYHVYESAAANADALLMIVAAVSDEVLEELIKLCDRLEMAALVEVHTEEEVARAVNAGAGIIGVNNRDLQTFEVTLETSLRLRDRIPSNCLAVSESGIRSVADLVRLQRAGYDAILIGEHLMTAQDPGGELAAMLKEYKQTPRHGIRS